MWGQMQQSQFRRLTRLIIPSLAVLILTLFTNAATAGASATSTSKFTANADAYVDRSHPRANFGRTQLRIENTSQIVSFLRFTLSGMTTPVTKATLRIYVKSSSSAGFELHSVPDNDWSETGITYQNAPPVSATVTATSGPVGAGTWVSIDVTSLVQGNGTRSIALVGRNNSALNLASRESGVTAPQLVLQLAAVPEGRLLWSGDAETGDMSQWYLPDVIGGPNNGGGIFNSGFANATISSDVAHSGRYSARMSITTPNDPASGTRLFRWYESQRYGQAYYSAWYYLPQVYTPSQYWNIFQFKSKTAANNDPFWILNVGNRQDTGNMYLYLYYWQSGTGPTPNEVGPVSYSQSLADLPVKKWVHIEAYLKQAADFTGHITVWQDGAVIFDKGGVKTRYSDGDEQWSLDNYSSGIGPSTAAIYIDDAAISTAFIP